MNRRPWETHSHIWKTESAYLNWIRGGIRRYLWSKNPVKLEFVKDRTIRLKNTNPRSMKRFPTLPGGQCDICQEVFRLDAMEVDHKTGEHSLKGVGDIQKFVEGIVFVDKEDLSLLCVPCHEVKTLAERQGLSLAHARVRKEVIALTKKPAATVKTWLTKRGVKPAANADLRREQVEEIMMKEASL